MATTTTTLGEEISRKNAIRSAEKLYDISGQAPSPSKDYCQLLVTVKGIVWRRWPITLRNRSQGWFPTPREDVMSYEDFEYDKDFQSELEYIFGSKSVRLVHRIVSGCYDPFSCLPEDLAVRVVLNLDLQSIKYLSQTNKHFWELCNSNNLWKRLYVIHQGKPSVDVQAIANNMSWKKLFFLSKLQVQKEISRLRRRTPSSPKLAVSTGASSSTFLTQQVED